jgi:hypothetical protein
MSKKSDAYNLPTSLVCVLETAQLACITGEAELLQDVASEIIVQKLPLHFFISIKIGKMFPCS